MNKLFGKKGRILIIVAIVLGTVISLMLSPLVNINYDLTKYLPEKSNTKMTLEVLEDEFGKTSMVQMMSTNLNIAEAEEVANEISKINVVRSVVWLGSVADISVPVDNLDQELVKEFYNDGNLLFTIEFKEDDYSLVVGEAIDEILHIMKDHNINVHLRGSALGNKSSRDLVSSEMFMILVVAVPIAILILFLASSSWFEPVIILVNIGVAIAINMGTNYLMPSVSYITISIASILQLAMSLDYSLFIVHRYYEVRESGLEPVDAAVQSTKEAFGSVTASALTTIFGFLALVIMRYKIGMDVGLSLAKAIVISFVVTILFIPVLLIIFDKIILKLKHKMLIPRFSKITNFLHKRRIVVTTILIVIGVAAFYGQSKVNFMYGDKPNSEETSQLYVDRIAMEEQFGVFEPVIVLYHKDDMADAILLAEELQKIPEVTLIQSLITSVDPSISEDIIPEEALAQFKGNKDYYRMIVYLNIMEESERAYELSNEIVELTNKTLKSGGYVTGNPIAITEIKESVTFDGLLVQLVSALAIMIVIGIILKNPVLAVILVLLIEIAIWINISITTVTGGVLVYVGYLVVSSLQLGATIDYAVLATSRYQEFRKELKPKEAMIEAMNKSAPAIITSAAVLTAAGFIVVMVSSIQIVKEIGMLVGRGALISGLMVLFILPAMLLMFDKLILKTNIKLKRKEKKEVETNETK